MKDKYVETIRNAGFQNVEITEEKQDASFEDIANDPNAKVMVIDKKTNTEKLTSISELDDEKKGMIKQIVTSTASISVSAMKPLKN